MMLATWRGGKRAVVDLDALGTVFGEEVGG
jgi:hypothetical protein